MKTALYREKPLRLFLKYALPQTVGVAIALGIQTIVRLFGGNTLGGFPTVILLLLIVGGFIMISLGIIGHYISKIYDEVKDRPRYIISRSTDEKKGDRA